MDSTTVWIAIRRNLREFKNIVGRWEIRGPEKCRSQERDERLQCNCSPQQSFFFIPSRLRLVQCDLVSIARAKSVYSRKPGTIDGHRVWATRRPEEIGSWSSTISQRSQRNRREGRPRGVGPARPIEPSRGSIELANEAWPITTISPILRILDSWCFPSWISNQLFVPNSLFALLYQTIERFFMFSRWHTKMIFIFYYKI